MADKRNGNPHRTALTDNDAATEPLADGSWRNDSDREASPGPLRSESWITLQTRQAQRLVSGRRGGDGASSIVGLTLYATMLRPMWTGAKADDPWADWWLVRVHDALEQSFQELDVQLEHVNRILRQMPGVSVTIAVSIEPLRIPLSFTNPYAFRGAYLLAKFDELVRAALTAKHVAMVDREAGDRLITEGGRQVRRAYNAALGYRFLGLNREDVRLMTARAHEAVKIMGSVPQDIVETKLRAPFAPEIARARAAAMSIETAMRLRRTERLSVPAETPPPDAPVLAPEAQRNFGLAEANSL